MRYHLIAIGGAVMHNLALELSASGHHVTGSDDEIYEPSRSRLARQGLLPQREGWYPENIHPQLDAVILGMHAKADNPELQKALALNLPVFSFPEFIFHESRDKTRVVIAGSHGKTTTTGMIMHALHHAGAHFDYLVGAQLPGFERMVKLSDAPVIILEGDEYLSSALDNKPKFLHYDPRIAVITGIAWDHMNVFPTLQNYISQFENFLASLKRGCLVLYDATDPMLKSLVTTHWASESMPYVPYPVLGQQNGYPVVSDQGGNTYIMKIFGDHNLKNLKAAQLVCQQLDLAEPDFLAAMQTFSGPSKRLQILSESEQLVIYRDFAHAPSKVRATVQAIRQRYPGHCCIACLELHTYSSLNKRFLPHYRETLRGADQAFVYYSPKTLAIKHLPPLSIEEIKRHFAFDGLHVNTDIGAFAQAVKTAIQNPAVLLFMSSGHFGGLDLTVFSGTNLPGIDAT